MNDISKYLENNKIRPTAMRLLIFDYMAKKETASTLSDVEAAFAKAERTTLYRTLKTFEEKGIVHQIDDGTGVMKYALCPEGCNCELNSDLHLHFHCTVCKETVCLTDHKIPQITLPKGYSATEANLVVKGICANCKGQ